MPAPLHGSDWDTPALGDFYHQAFNGLVSLPVAGYDYNSDWTPPVGGTLKQLAELKDNVDLRKRLAKKIAHDCFRDTKTLENMHAANLITDDEMKAIMTEATDKCYSLVLDLCSPHGIDIINDLKQRDEVPQWDDPEVRIYRRP